MDSFELNKILGAILGTCLVLLSLNITAGAIFTPAKVAKPGYEIAVPDHPGEQAKGPAEPEQPIEVRLASASTERGTNAAKVCQACHTFEKGGAKKTGPNLWGVVGRKHASVGDFNYSNGMKAMTGTWTVQELDQFLANPKAMVKGTSMGFAGLTRPAQRADVIAYLNSLSDNPQPLPTAAAAPAAPPAQANAPAPAKQAPAKH